MMKAAMIFPGQGSQYVGMGKDLVEKFPAVADVYREADDMLHYPLSRLCFQGDPEVLTQTRNAQPAILLHSIAVLGILRDEAGAEPAITAGHSLGEYSALVAAGVLSPMDALRIVRRRGELMFDAGHRQPGTMAAVIGMTREDVEAVCREATTGDAIVVVANVNSPMQIVISGHIDAVGRAMELAGSRGAKKTIQLNVSGAFHSPLVEPAQRELVEFLGQFTFKEPAVGLVCNVDAKVIRDTEAIVNALSRQLTNPVLWSDSMQVLTGGWKGRIMEVGPGTVLSGLMKRTDRSRPVEACGTAEQLEHLIAVEVEPA
ncbi:MAG TPA: ACP S-malonyltransferase [Patescibacteria group bacterium]|nr:ACP S-malonyltransferase [Patescibacteria group bacterium]